MVKFGEGYRGKCCRIVILLGLCAALWEKCPKIMGERGVAGSQNTDSKQIGEQGRSEAPCP